MDSGPGIGAPHSAGWNGTIMAMKMVIWED